MLFLKNVVQRHNNELVYVEFLVTLLNFLHLSDRFLLELKFTTLLDHSNLLFFQSLQVCLHSFPSQRRCEHARVMIAVTQSCVVALLKRRLGEAL